MNASTAVLTTATPATTVATGSFISRVLAGDTDAVGKFLDMKSEALGLVIDQISAPADTRLTRDECYLRAGFTEADLAELAASKQLTPAITPHRYWDGN